MRLGLRGKLFLTIFGIVAAVVLLGAAILPRGIARSLEERTARELEHESSLAGLFLSRELDAVDIATADPVADRLGSMLGNRVTIILSDGRVVGDSELSPAEVAEVESHADRPEVRKALAEGRGSTSRYSTTLAHDLMYVARRFERGGAVGVVRIAKSLAEVRDASRALYGLLALAGLVGLGIAAIVASISSRSFSRALSALVVYAERAQEGDARPPGTARTDELGGLATSVQKLAERLGAQVAELASERRRFEDILEGMTEALIALDEHRRVTLVNRAAVVLLGQTAPSVGRTILELVRVPELNALLNGVEPGGETTSEFDLGAVAPRRVLARAKRRETGDYVVVLLDVTELRRLENVRRDFVANVSHELRTPVSIIKANTETLLDGAVDDPDASRRFLSSVATHADRLANLISDLLDISRLEEGKLELKRERVSLDAAFRRAFAALEIHAEEKRTTLRIDSPGSLEVACDMRGLDQVLFNLVDNAIKYTPSGSTVVLRAMGDSERAVIEVADDGNGIEPKHRDRLFERFYRVDPGRSREMGGTGLGLAIVKHLVTAMGGRVGMRPAEPHGSVFWVSLPASAD